MLDDFVACDHHVKTCDSTTTNLENQILDDYFEQHLNKILAENDAELQLLEENKKSSSAEKGSKSS